MHYQSSSRYRLYNLIASRAHKIKAWIEILGLGSTIGTALGSILSGNVERVHLAYILLSACVTLLAGGITNKIEQLAVTLDNKYIPAKIITRWKFLWHGQDYKMMVFGNNPTYSMLCVMASRHIPHACDHLFRSDSDERVVFSFTRDKSIGWDCQHHAHSHPTPRRITHPYNTVYMPAEYQLHTNTVYVNRGVGWRYHFYVYNNTIIRRYLPLPYKNCWYSEYYRGLFAFDARCWNRQRWSLRHRKIIA